MVTFAPGDVVKLNSGSPPLTVSEILPVRDDGTPEMARIAYVDSNGELRLFDAPVVCFSAAT